MTTAPDTVAIWTMEVAAPPPAALARWRALLDLEESAQAERFRREADRHAFIAAHALTRRLLEAVGRHAAASWQFKLSESGKPQIAGGPAGLEFSHSHTDGLVACAAGRFPLGIDAESRGRRPVGAGVAEAILAPSELALLEAAPPDLRHETFLRLWTLREAHGKATGQGIHFPREKFSFALDPARILFEKDGDAGAWQLFDWSTDGHILALAVNQDRRSPITVERRSFAQDEF